MVPSASSAAVAGDCDMPLQTWAARAPVTAERKLNVNLQEEMPQPCKKALLLLKRLYDLARALVAADPAHPEGTAGHEHNNMSLLQQHVAFFDRNHDGVVYPWETYQGMRAIGCGVLLSIGGGFLINLSLSYFTVPFSKFALYYYLSLKALVFDFYEFVKEKLIVALVLNHSRTTNFVLYILDLCQGCLPNPLLPIYIKDIHKCKHGSATLNPTTPKEGWFAPEKFDAIFSKYATTYADALTEDELNKMLKANRNIYDFIGWIMSYAEWKLLYSVAKDEEGLLHRDAVRGVYDGSVFEYLEKRNAGSHKKKA
ncbi:putative peroxygenase 3 [Nymphaea thermarum]|nr:putative peroxygenase 3 [Nymphaea thermarum]